MDCPVFQRQIRPRLTGLFYLGICGLLGLAAMHSQVNLLFWMFGLMLSGFMLGLVHAGLNLHGVSLERFVDERTSVAGALTIRYRLRHRKRWVPAFGLRIRELAPGLEDRLAHRPEAWQLHLAPGQTVEVQTIVRPRSRGMLVLNRVEVSTAFPLGLARFSKIFTDEQTVLVYPQLRQIHTMSLRGQTSFDLVGQRPGQREGGREEFYGLREYQHGDAMRQIDWKQTARIGEPISREMTRPEPPSLVLLLDLRHAPAAERAEEAISFAASMIHHAAGHGMDVGLWVVGVEGPSLLPSRSAAHVAKMLGVLAQLDLSKNQAEPPAIPGRMKYRWLVLQASEGSPVALVPGAKVMGMDQMSRWAADQPQTVSQEMAA